MAQSRVEAILKSASSPGIYQGRPLSRVEALLMGLDEYIDEGGSGSGSSTGPTGEQDFEDSDVNDIMSVISTENN